MDEKKYFKSFKLRKNLVCIWENEIEISANLSMEKLRGVGIVAVCSAGGPASATS